MVTAVDEQVVNEDFFATPEVTPPPQEADAHRIIINNISTRTFDSGATKVEVNATSIDMGNDLSYGFFVPTPVLENWDEVIVKGNTDVLSQETPINPETGKKKQSQLQRYGAIFSSSKGTAEFQTLRAIAKASGRTLADSGYTSMPKTFVEFITAHSNLLSGIEGIAVRRPRKDDNPQYDGQLEVKRLYPADAANNPKLFKGVVKRWE